MAVYNSRWKGILCGTLPAPVSLDDGHATALASGKATTAENALTDKAAILEQSHAIDCLPSVVSMDKGSFPALEALLRSVATSSSSVPPPSSSVTVRVTQPNAPDDVLVVSYTAAVQALIKYEVSVLRPRRVVDDDVDVTAPRSLWPLFIAFAAVGRPLPSAADDHYDAGGIFDADRERRISVQRRIRGCLSTDSCIPVFLEDHDEVTETVLDLAKCIHFASALSVAAGALHKDRRLSMEEAYMRASFAAPAFPAAAAYPHVPDWATRHDSYWVAYANARLLEFFAARGTCGNSAKTAADIVATRDEQRFQYSLERELSFEECVLLSRDAIGHGGDSVPGELKDWATHPIHPTNATRATLERVIGCLAATLQYREISRVCAIADSVSDVIAVEIRDRRITLASAVSSLDRLVGRIIGESSAPVSVRARVDVKFVVARYGSSLFVVASRMLLRGVNLYAELLMRLQRLKDARTVRPDEYMLGEAIADALQEAAPGDSTGSPQPSAMRMAGLACRSLLLAATELSPSRRALWPDNANVQAPTRERWCFGFDAFLADEAAAQRKAVLQLEHRLFCRPGQSTCVHVTGGSAPIDAPARRLFDGDGRDDVCGLTLFVRADHDPRAPAPKAARFSSPETMRRFLCNPEFVWDWHVRWSRATWKTIPFHLTPADASSLLASRFMPPPPPPLTSRSLSGLTSGITQAAAEGLAMLERAVAARAKQSAAAGAPVEWDDSAELRPGKYRSAEGQFK